MWGVAEWAHRCHVEKDTILRFLAGKVVQTMQICIYNEYTYIPPAQLAQYYSDSHHLRT